ncbi:hypothetical protein KPL37_18210 [Clostridium frigoris]|uniref:Uncharacterized protein n=1 Tax=Clostridium frigoris TaxID=205327 RepID=A0ABS6BYE7_9CLOT|nr:hypothetical protein [Clostridium frigoris]MBU3161634.1 hypothetical protein [Clostridium frigoris]
MIKMDEMELSISLKAMKWTLVYTTIFLVIWDIYDYTQTGILGIGFILLISQNLVLMAIQSFLKWKLGKNEK